MRKLLTCFALAATAGPAAACINDVELPTHEREFRSQYRTPVTPPEPVRSDSADPGNTRVLLGAGAVLLVGATVVAVRKPRAEA